MSKSADEFCNYEYLKDKDGDYITGYVDADNHFIDSVRYAIIYGRRKETKICLEIYGLWIFDYNI